MSDAQSISLTVDLKFQMVAIGTFDNVWVVLSLLASTL